MLRYLLGRLWKNPIARYGMLAAAVLISFSLIFSARFRLYTFFYRLFNSPDWSDVVRHATRPYAFEENEARAQKLTIEAWTELYKLALEKNGSKKYEEPAIVGTITQKPFAQFLRRHAEEEIFILFNALAKDCGAVRVSLAVSDTASVLGEVAEANAASGRVRPHLKETIEAVLKIYTTKTEAALQKKPDYLPALELAEEQFRAACSMREIAPLYARALDYREYRLQKQLYEADSGKLYTRNPEDFHARAHEAYARDAQYRELLARHFQATRFRLPQHPAQLKNLRDSYALLRNRATAKALIQGLLAEARHSDIKTARQCHYELFALDYPGLVEDAEYLFALAETALRGGEYIRARNIIANARKVKSLTESLVWRDFERLAFVVELHVHESENLSRF